MALEHVLEKLEQAEITWREIVQTEFPLFSDTHVIKAKPDPKNQRHWQFYTKCERDAEGRHEVHMDVFKPDVVDKAFNGRVKDIFSKAYGLPSFDAQEFIRRLHHDNFTYLYFHELLHHLYCPDSKDDEKQVDKALHDGIKKVTPNVPDADILNKVGNSRNSAWDLLDDGSFFYLSHYHNQLEQRLSRALKSRNLELPQAPELPDGVITVFDVVEMELKKDEHDSLYYPLTRGIYALLFCKEKETRGVVFDYFRSHLHPKMRGKEQEVLTSALKSLLKELTPDQLKFAGINKGEFERNVDEFYQKYATPEGDKLHEKLIHQIIPLLLDKNTRYAAIEGFIQPLAPYISLQKEEKRHGTHIGEGEGGSGQGTPTPGQGDQASPTNQSGGNTQQALQNLADVLGQNEGNQLLANVANNPGGSQGGKSQKEQKLSNLARDEYYKRNVKEIPVRSPNQEAVSVELGNIKLPVLVASYHLKPEEIISLDLEQIIRFQQETGITQLFQISDYEWKYDVYEWKETELKDYRFDPTGIDLPANIVFHVDSSSSMGSPNYVGTGSPYDTLMHVCYGMLKALMKPATEMSKEINVIAANFSNGTILSQPSELKHLYDTPNNSTKQVLTGFQNGGTEYSSDTFKKIKPMLKPGKTVHVWITDGGLESNSAPATYDEIEQATRDSDVSFLYFEIGSQSSFGGRIKQLESQRSNVKCHMGVTIQQIQSQALEVLIEYTDRKKFSEVGV